MHSSWLAAMTSNTHLFNGTLSRTTRVSRNQKGKTNLDFTEARDSKWYWHQLGHMQVCISLQTDNHASTPPLCFLQAGCPSCCPTNSVKALKARTLKAWHAMTSKTNKIIKRTLCLLTKAPNIQWSLQWLHHLGDFKSYCFTDWQSLINQMHDDKWVKQPGKKTQTVM